MVEKFRDKSFEIQQLAVWALSLLLEFGVKKDLERRTLDVLDPKFKVSLEYGDH